MKKFILAGAVLSAFFSLHPRYVSAAGGGALLALAPVSGAAAPGGGPHKSTAAYARNESCGDSVIGYTEFDGFNNIDDPLYRAGSKALLQRALDEDKNAETRRCAGAPPRQLRDAPSDAPASGGVISGPSENLPVPPLKRNRLMKMVPADPIKAKQIL